MPQLISFKEFGPIMTKLVTNKVGGFLENAWTEVVKSTPVKTGYVRKNWYVRPRVPVMAPMPEKKNPKGNYKYPTMKTNVHIGKKLHPEYHLTNPTAYIGVLNTGTSKQAPSMFVQKAILRAVIKFNSAKNNG